MPNQQLIAVALALLLGCGAPLPPHTEGFVPLSGGDRLFYRLYGPGPDTVVVLHGGPSIGSSYLEAALAPVARQHAVLFYDQRGRGNSPVAAHLDSLSYDRDLEDLEALRSHFHLDSMTLVGHHWGAALAFGFGLRHPDEVRRVVLIAPMGGDASFIYQLASLPKDSVVRAQWLTAMDRKKDSLDPAGYCHEFWGFAFSPAEVTKSSVVHRLAPAICDATPDRLRDRSAVQRQLMKTLGRWSWRDSLPLLKAPTLVVSGDQTSLLAANAQLWAGTIPDGRFLLLHGPALFPWLEAGDAWSRDLGVFLGGAWPGPAVRPAGYPSKT